MEAEKKIVKFRVRPMNSMITSCTPAFQAIWHVYYGMESTASIIYARLYVQLLRELLNTQVSNFIKAWMDKRLCRTNFNTYMKSTYISE